jgi:hypothetical protein
MAADGRAYLDIGERLRYGAEGEVRTRTGSPPAVFKGER